MTRHKGASETEPTEPASAAEAEEPASAGPPLAEGDVSPVATSELAALEAGPPPSVQDRLDGDLTVPMRDLEEPFSGIFSDTVRTEGQPYRRSYPGGKPENYRRSGG